MADHAEIQSNPGFIQPFAVQFDPVTGLSSDCQSLKRRLSNMAGMYADEEERARLEARQDQVVYEFSRQNAPADPGEIEFGMSIVYPGLVGREYYMTNGHFHAILDTAEVYYCMHGEGYLMQENPEGEWNAIELRPGAAVYCLKRYAHRSINTGETPLVLFYAFRGDAGHDYGTIKERGFRKIIVMQDGKPAIIDNPRRTISK
jgi:glucose-6-phosphate isomerase, archaeal